MDKSIAFVTLLVSAFCFSSLLALAQAHERFKVIGMVYCDPCRLEFDNKLTKPLPGATVSLSCKFQNNETETFKSKEVVTKHNGLYNIKVEADQEGQTCQVKALKSTDPECNEPILTSTKTDPIVLVKLAENEGVPKNTYFVNSLGFMPKKVTDKQCESFVTELS